SVTSHGPGRWMRQDRRYPSGPRSPTETNGSAVPRRLSALQGPTLTLEIPPAYRTGTGPERCRITWGGVSVPEDPHTLGGRAGALRVVVADDVPVDRRITRFFLEAQGIEVVGEAAGGAEAVRQVGEQRPDAVVLHVSLTADQDYQIVPAIRRVSPRTRVILFTPPGADPSVEARARGADAGLEEGIGLKDVSYLIHRLCRLEVVKDETVPAAEVIQIGAMSTTSPTAGALETAELPPAAERVGPVPAEGEPGARTAVAEVWAYPRSSGDVAGRWYARLQGAAAVLILVFAFAVFRGASGNIGPVAGEGGAAAQHLRSAITHLNELVGGISSGSSEDLIAQAQALVQERDAAIRAGADVSQLDTLIGQLIPGLLVRVPQRVATALPTVLPPISGGPAELPPPPTAPPPVPPPPPPRAHPIPTPTETPPTEEPSPSPKETPSPSPTETPSPSPTETPTPSPPETPYPSPTETPTPSPTETPSPSPTETPTPSPTETPSPSPTETPTPSPTETPSPSPT